MRWQRQLAIGVVAALAVAASTRIAVFPSVGIRADCDCRASRHDWWFESTPRAKRGVVVDCANSTITDADPERAIDRLQDLSSVFLDLHRSAVSDAGAVKLAELQSLLRLNVAGTRITGAGLAPFAGLGGLIVLEADAATLTDEGCRNIGRIASLRRLFVTGHKSMKTWWIGLRNFSRRIRGSTPFSMTQL
ncbi:MAG TPA: hypothetical protein VGM05_05715 [Planctomycetaceae bacterium]